MNGNASNCYYHPDRGTVATCAKCGVGICSECAVKDDRGRVLCYKCGNELLKQEHKEYRKWLKERGGRFSEGRDFIKPGIVGFLFAAVVIGLSIAEGILALAERASLPGFIGALLFLAYMLFSIPFCFLVLDDLLVPKHKSWFSSVYFLFQIVVSVLFGWVVFTFIWVRLLVRKNKAKKGKTPTANDQADTKR